MFEPISNFNWSSNSQESQGFGKINFMFSETRIQKIWRGATCDKIYVILKIFWTWSMTIRGVINKTPTSPA